MVTQPPAAPVMEQAWARGQRTCWAPVWPWPWAWWAGSRTAAGCPPPGGSASAPGTGWTRARQLWRPPSQNTGQHSAWESAALLPRQAVPCPRPHPHYLQHQVQPLPRHAPGGGHGAVSPAAAPPHLLGTVLAAGAGGHCASPWHLGPPLPARHNLTHCITISLDNIINTVTKFVIKFPLINTVKVKGKVQSSQFKV